MNFAFLEIIKPHKTIHWVLYGLVVFLLTFCLVGWDIFLGLPNKDEIKNYRIHSTVESFENFNWEQVEQRPVRKWLPLSAIAANLQKAVIISEDDTFFEHKGVNLQMVKEAFKVNLTRRRYARGASTITMQLARNAFLTKEKSLIRKLKEIIVARRIEESLTKGQILELYLNIVEWGENIYGAEAAAQYYFGKAAYELNLAESSLLASILPNPKRFNPFRGIGTAKKLQKRVLDLMRLSRILDEQTAVATYGTPIYLRDQLPEESKIDAFQHVVAAESLTNSPPDSTVNTVMDFPDSIAHSNKSIFDSFSIHINFRDKANPDSSSTERFK
ncbi:MAG: transglycosylase domain-containing protein [bacterium]